ncbi:MATE family efflux transporter [Photobacterium sanguinicancri]|uniref:MATE family efflux transporter n=1 Tax=Photobacterium sanguinicancri TaxID=875932 RepID=UPI000786EC6F|nr:MATE family efflux transporter [Photobacterium sanguinicancri]KXI22002.1 hypothetical protein AS132_16530 [Photobacterium sanguinicancri]
MTTKAKRRSENIAFIKSLVVLTIPVALQTIMFSSRNLSDVLMTSSMGADEVTAIGLASKYAMVSTILLFGIATGASQVLAQHKGKKDHLGFSQSFCSLVCISIPIAMMINVSFYLLSTPMVSIFTHSKNVIDISSDFIEIISFQMIFAAIGISFNIGLRVLLKPSISTFFSAIGIVLNIFLNYVLIFGHWGFPHIGALGAAWATLVSCIVEVVLLLIYVYTKNIEISYSPHQYFQRISRLSMLGIIQLSTPVVTSGLALCGGTFVYAYTLSKSGTSALAALSVILPIESFSLAFLMGLSSGASVLIGRYIGEGNVDESYQKGLLAILFTVVVSFPFMLVMYLVQDNVIELFSGISNEAINLANDFYSILIISILIKSLSSIISNGVLRSGGDNIYCLKMDIISQWLITIPLVFVLGIYAAMPAAIVFLFTLTEDFIKVILGFKRVKTRKWINDITVNHP